MQRNKLKSVVQAGPNKAQTASPCISVGLHRLEPWRREGNIHRGGSRPKALVVTFREGAPEAVVDNDRYAGRRAEPALTATSAVVIRGRCLPLTLPCRIPANDPDNIKQNVRGLTTD